MLMDDAIVSPLRMDGVMVQTKYMCVRTRAGGRSAQPGRFAKTRGARHSVMELAPVGEYRAQLHSTDVGERVATAWQRVARHLGVARRQAERGR